MEEDRGNRLLSQIEAFLSKVNVSQNSFSGPKLLEFISALKLISRAEQIESIAMLKQVVKRTTDLVDSNTSSFDYNDNKTLVYFKWLIEFHGYLRSLKESFDARVHRHLLHYFYDSPYSAPSPSKRYFSGKSTVSSGYDSTDMQRDSTFNILSNTARTIHPALRETYKEYKQV